MPRTLSKKTKAMAEIDIRLCDLMMRFLETDGDIESNLVLGYMRTAYVQGYTDCLKEAPEIRGKWITDLGYGVRATEEV